MFHGMVAWLNVFAQLQFCQHGEHLACSACERHFSEVLLALLFLARTELGDVGVVTFLDVPVSALQHRLLGQTLHRVLLDHTQPPVRRPRCLTEVDTTYNGKHGLFLN